MYFIVEWLFSRLSWDDALGVCKQQNMSLFKYIDEGSLLQLYNSAKQNAKQFGWHGLGDVVYVGARFKVSNTIITHLLITIRYIS